MEQPLSPKKTWINGILFVLTAFSIFFFGLTWSLNYVYAEDLAKGVKIGPYLDVLLQPRILGLSLVYAVALLVILLGHEFGHYLMCRRYGLEASLPYFIPFPNLIGTFGAFIRIKSRITNKPYLFDIGAAGPLMSFLLSLPALGIGLALSKPVPPLPTEGALIFGEPLLFKLIGSLVMGDVPAGYDVAHHPLAIAGWVGIFVTSLNLFPIGQLDGGHIAYAVLGKRARNLSKAFIVFFFVMGIFFYMGWAVLAVVILFIGLKHPALADEEIPLSSGRMKLAALAAVVFVLSFVPDPIRGYDGLTLFKSWLPSLKSAIEGLRLF